MGCNVTGGRFDRQFHPMSVLSITIFQYKLRLFLGVFLAGLLVINCTFGIMLNSCGNLDFNTLTLASLVCLCRGSNRLVSWQVLRASLRAISPQTQACRACHLDPKHSRFRVRTCSDNSSFLVSFGQEQYSHSRLFSVKILSLLKASMTVPQWEFPALSLVKIHSHREPFLPSLT